MKIYIRNMVCDRCRAAVQNELTDAGIKFASVELGEIEVDPATPASALKTFKGGIERLGFELIEDKSALLVNQIKKVALDFVRNGASRKRTKFSGHLSEQLGRDYSTLSSLFSSIEGTTIEQYIIHQKIELAKELLVYGELSLGQIADQLGYSSIQHLSNQFKKITGLTPSHFKKVGAEKRVSLDKV